MRRPARGRPGGSIRAPIDRRTKGLTTESASRPRSGRAVWKTPVLYSGPLPPGDPRHPRSPGAERLPPSGYPPLWKGLVDRHGDSVLRTRGARSLGTRPGTCPRGAARDHGRHVVRRRRARSPSTTACSRSRVPSDMVRERLQHNHLDLIRARQRPRRSRAVRVEIDADRGRARMRHPRGDAPDPVAAAGHSTRAAPVGAGRLGRTARWARPGLPFPELHVRRVRARTVQPVRARGGHGRRRGAAVEGLQPAVHLRRRGAGQDPPADRRRPSHVPAQAEPPREVRHVGAVRHRVHQGGPRAAGRQLPPAVPRGRRAAGRRHPVPRQARGDADRVLPHVQPPARRRASRS